MHFIQTILLITRAGIETKIRRNEFAVPAVDIGKKTIHCGATLGILEH